jgi:hypothetical protein
MFDRRIFAPIMETYYGGRAEVRLRRMITEVLYCDFKAMYPTVNALLGFNEYLIAKCFETFDRTDDVRELVDRIQIDDLQKPEVWKQLHAIVRVHPNEDIFPARAKYSEALMRQQGATGYKSSHSPTIGLNYVTYDNEIYYTLADVVVSKLLNGKSPEIVKAIGFKPGPRQERLRSINLLGRADYRFDPNTDDLFVSLINMRDEAKAKGDPIEKQLKILANSTCYGIFAEFVRENPSVLETLLLYTAEGNVHNIQSRAIERPGTYFNPFLASTITGAARLMLACAEYLALDTGLNWAFCDTDSIALANTVDLPRKEFHRRCYKVIDWFEPLNPYAEPGSILKIEDANYKVGTAKTTKELVTLYVWAISAKRYALFNLDDQRRPDIRKASAHGLGHLLTPGKEYKPVKHVPIASENLSDIGVSQWQYDLWYQIIEAALDGHPNKVSLDYHPPLSLPAQSRYSATSPDLLGWMKHFNREKPYSNQVKPFGFMIAPIPKRGVWLEPEADIVAEPKRGRPTERKHCKPIAPFGTELRADLNSVFDRETGELIGADQLKTYAQVLALYHLSPEHKFENGDAWDSGETGRRRIIVSQKHLIGKEANKIGDFGDTHPIEGAAITYQSKS